MRGPQFRFYHDQLPDDYSRSVYEAVEKSVLSMERVVHVPAGPAGTEWYRLLEHVYDDHPEMFSFYPLMCRISVGVWGVTITLAYRYEPQTVQRWGEELDARAEDILRVLFPNGSERVSELEREKKIFDWITANVVYDHDALRRSSAGSEVMNSLAWNAYGALILRKAVCEGIACAFKLLCDRVGLPCIVALGQAKGRHAWNIVRIGGRFYHVDCTWDLKATLARNVPFARYRYFNLPDEMIRDTHTPESKFLPRCGSMRYNPFRMRGLCAAKKEEILSIALQTAKMGEKRFALMCLGDRIEKEDASVYANEMSAVLGGNAVTWHLDDTGRFIGFIVH